MNNPFDFFDKIYCIHLPENTERRTHLEKEFGQMGIVDRVEYVSADKPHKELAMSNFHRNPAGEFGCNLSHIKAVIHALDVGAKTPLFFEDDVRFLPDASENLTKALADLPKDWNIFYLSGRPRSHPEKISNNLVRMNMIDLATSYSIPGRNLLRYIDSWLNDIGKPFPHSPYDVILSNFVNDNYCAYPMICTQRTVLSSISGKVNNIETYTQRGWNQYSIRK